MKLIFIIFTFFLNLNCEWSTDYKATEARAREEKKKILIYFSGSDWCTYCKQLEGSMLNKKDFCDFASQQILLYNADFPRKKKHEQDAALKTRNEELQTRYNPKKEYPALVLIDADGNELKRWDGYQQISTSQFIQDLRCSK